MGKGSIIIEAKIYYFALLKDEESFYVPCICSVLAKGNLEERRMQL